MYPPELRIPKKVFSPTSVENYLSSLEVPVNAAFSSSEVPVDAAFSTSEVQVDAAFSSSEVPDDASFSLKEVAILDKTYVAGNRKKQDQMKKLESFWY